MSNDAKLRDRVNHATMQSVAVVAQYARRDNAALRPAEAAALATIADAVRGQPILDIGVGGGRTVTALRALSPDYLGIDYSQPMIDAVSRRFADARFRHADARDMSFIADASMALAVFSCNGIGMVSHIDRLAILREVRRVLKPGGVFLFSTHNQRSAEHDAGFNFPSLELSTNPARLVVRSARFARATALRIYNRWRLNRHAERSPEYSIINDECHDYGVMLYYITLASQRAQLVALGFSPNAAAFDLAGHAISDGNDSTDSSLTLIARV